MGQGNAIAHLMPPPFYAYRMVVAKARAPESSIQDQIDQIHDATAENRYKIEVMPGIYPEAITMKQYVDVCAPYGRVRIQPPAGSIHCVTFADDCMLQGVEVNLTNAGPNASGVYILAKDGIIVEDCWITGGEGGDVGVNICTTGNDVIIRNSRIDQVAKGLWKAGSGPSGEAGTGILWFLNNRVTAYDGGFDVDIDDGTLNAYDNEFLCNTLGGANANIDVNVSLARTTTVNSYNNILGCEAPGAAFLIADAALAKVFSHNDTFTSVIHSGNKAGFMVAYEEPQTYRVNNGMKIADALTDITDADDTTRYSIKVFPGEYNEPITMKQYVDLVGESNQSCVITQAAGSVITCNANSRIKSVRVELTAADTDIAIICEDVYGYLEDVICIVTHSAGTNACVGSSAGGGFELHDCVLEINNVASYPITTDGEGIHLVYDSELINTGVGGYGMDVAAGTTTITISSFNNKLRSDNGFRIANSANAIALSYGDDYTTVVFVGAAGEFVDLTGCRLYTCAAGVKVREWVYVSSDDTVAEADADALATMPSMGVVVWKPGMPAADTGLTCYVKNYGYLYDASGPWTNGEEYWISATEGEITTTMHPVWPQRAGVAVSTQRFKILIGDNLGLVHCNEYLCAHDTIVEDQWVYMTAVDDTVGLADSDAAGTMVAIGVCVAILDDTGDPDIILVKLRGKNSVSDTTVVWVPSDDVYISATAGAITNVIPGGIIQKVAEVKNFSTPTLIYEIAD